MHCRTTTLYFTKEVRPKCVHFVNIIDRVNKRAEQYVQPLCYMP